MPSETRTSLISLFGSILSPPSPAPGPHLPPPRGLWHSLIDVGLISKLPLMSASGLP